MRPHTRAAMIVAGLLSFVGPLASSSAHAQAATPPTDAQRAAAREAYASGQALFREGQFPESEAAFLEAYAQIPNPVVLLGVAEARERQGNLTGAVEALEQYLAGRPDAPDRASVEARIATMRATPSTIVVTSDPPGGAIFLDGEDTGEVTPASLETTEGEHTVAVHHDGFEPGEETITTVFATRHELTVSMIALVQESLEGDGDPLAGVPPVEDAEDEDEDDGPSAAVWATSGIAAASLVTGTVLGFLALSRESEFDDAPDSDTADQGERFALFADVAFGIAAVSAITAIVIFLTADSDEDEDDEEAGVTARVAPVVGNRSGGFSAVVEF